MIAFMQDDSTQLGTLGTAHLNGAAWDGRTFTQSEEQPLWNKRQTAKFLGVSPKTLDYWLSKGRGPRAIKIGNHERAFVRYRSVDVYAYLESCRAVGGGVAA